MDTKNRKKTVMVPVMHDDASNPAATMAAQDYSGDARPEVLIRAHNFLAFQCGNSHMRETREADRARLGEIGIRQEELAVPILPHLDLLEHDAVERNRTKLPGVWSVFIPDQINYQDNPVNFLNIENPYTKSLPSYFPHGEGDFDSATRSTSVSETDFVIHYLRYARKELSTFRPFVFNSLYRIDTARTVASSHAYRGFSVQGAADGEETGDRGSKFLFYKLPGSSDYYAKVHKDLQAKCKVLGYPEFFYTFTNTDR